MVAAQQPTTQRPVDAAAARTSLRNRLQQLAAEVDATRRDEGFRAALRTMARFWRYSVLN
jgi:hypothetical protein